MTDQEQFMRAALQQAQIAFDQEEVPVGAVIVQNNQIIARGYNQIELLNDCTAHAEILCITAACNYLGSKLLTDCEMYVTLEPCPMCAGAIGLARLGALTFAAEDPKRGFMQFGKNILHKKTTLSYGLLEQDSVALLKRFFRQRR